LPYLEEANLYGNIDFSRPFFEQAEIGESVRPHQVYFNTHICPSVGRVGLIQWNNAHYGARGNYAANAGWAGADSGLWMNDIQWEQTGSDGRGIQRIQPASSFTPNGRPIHLPSGFGPFMINKDFLRGHRRIESYGRLSEVRTVEGDDIRGSLHFGGGVLYVHMSCPTHLCRISLASVCTHDAPARHYETWRGYHNFPPAAHPGGVKSCCSIRAFISSATKSTGAFEGGFHIQRRRVD
jgi:hypothetical protein